MSPRTRSRTLASLAAGASLVIVGACSNVAADNSVEQRTDDSVPGDAGQRPPHQRLPIAMTSAHCSIS